MRPSPRLPAFVVRPVASVAVPRIVAVVVAALSMTLLTIGARSPYTHSNLLGGFDPAYTRTEQIRVGPAEPYTGVGGTSVETADQVDRGGRLFITEGCVTCHALGATGGPVGPAIVGQSQDTIAQKVRKGPSGMPAYSRDSLTDDEVAAIAAYLRSLAK